MSLYLARINCQLAEELEERVKETFRLFWQQYTSTDFPVEDFKPHLTVGCGLLTNKFNKSEKFELKKYFQEQVFNKSFSCELLISKYYTVSLEIIETKAFRKFHFLMAKMLIKKVSPKMNIQEPPFYFNCLKYYRPHITIGEVYQKEVCNNLQLYFKRNLGVNKLNFTGMEFSCEKINQLEGFNASYR